MLRTNRLSAVIMALTVALAACLDGTGLDDVLDEVLDEVPVEVPVEVPFDAGASAADLQAVQGAFAATAFESFAVSSQDFILVADTTPLPVALLHASVAAATAGTRWEAAAAAEAFAAGPAASGPLLPDEFRGRTYVRVDGVAGYQWDSARTDAPATGVRFVLYEVDPVTGTPGTTEIGYVDLIDETTPNVAHVARVVVVTSGVVRIDYTVSAVVGTQSATLTVSGFIGDGTNQVDVDLSVTFAENPPVFSATVDHVISVPSRDFEVDATVVFEFNEETLQGSLDVDASFMQGAYTVTVAGVVTFSEGTVPTESGTFEIHVDGLLFAVVTVNNDTVTVQNGSGGELTAAEVDAVKRIFDGLEDLFDERFEDFVRPVAWMFEGAGSAAAA